MCAQIMKRKFFSYRVVLYSHYKFRHAVECLRCKVAFPNQFGSDMGDKIVARWSAIIATFIHGRRCYAFIWTHLWGGRLMAGSVFISSLWRHWYVILNLKKEEEESLRRLSRLTKNAEHRLFGLTKGTQSFGKGVVDAVSSHLQSTFVDWKMMTWTCFLWSLGSMFRYDDCCLHHYIVAVVSPFSLVQTDLCEWNFSCCDWHTTKYQ